MKKCILLTLILFSLFYSNIHSNNITIKDISSTSVTVKFHWDNCFSEQKNAWYDCYIIYCNGNFVKYVFAYTNPNDNIYFGNTKQWGYDECRIEGLAPNTEYTIKIDGSFANDRSDKCDNMGSIIIKTDPVYVINTDKNLICNREQAIFSLSGLAGGETFNWIAGNCTTISTGKCLTLISGQGTPTATFSALSLGELTGVKVEITLNGKMFTAEKKDIWTSAPAKVDGILGFEYEGKQFGENTRNSFYVKNPKSYHDSYTWQVVSGGSIIGSSNGNGVTVLTNSYNTSSSNEFSLRVKPSNRCGSNPPGFINFTIKGKIMPSSLILPSPNEENIYTSIDDNITSDIVIISAKVYSVTGMLIYSSNTIEKNFSIKSLGLNTGIYILETVDDGGNINREKVMIQK